MTNPKISELLNANVRLLRQRKQIQAYIEEVNESLKKEVLSGFAAIFQEYGLSGASVYFGLTEISVSYSKPLPQRKFPKLSIYIRYLNRNSLSWILLGKQYRFHFSSHSKVRICKVK